jgi:hypothetical protein
MSPAQLTCGGTVSDTVTSNEHVLVLPKVSVAEHITDVVVLWNPLPDGGTQVTSSGWPPPSTALALKLTGVNPPVHSSITAAVGQVMTGGGVTMAQLDAATVRTINEVETRVKMARARNLDMSPPCGCWTGFCAEWV